MRTPRAEYMRKYILNWKHKHAESGLCRQCSRPVLFGSTCCAFHHYRNNDISKSYYRRNKDKVIARNQVRMDKLRDEDRCVKCGVPLIEEEKGRCVNCRSHEKKWKGVLREVTECVSTR